MFNLGDIEVMFVQIVKFKLKSDSSRELFINLTEQMIKWLKNRSGFVAYELYEGSEFWSDRIAWENQEFAQENLKEFLATTIAEKIIHLVDTDYSSFFGHEVASAKYEQ